jgi:hypothetical protein
LTAAKPGLTFLRMPTKNNSKLEQEFTELVDTFGEQILAHCKDAARSLKAACDLADQHGIPFFTNVSLLGQPYVPETFKSKWGQLDKDFVTNLTDLTTNDLGYAYGWATSQVC